MFAKRSTGIDWLRKEEQQDMDTVLAHIILPHLDEDTESIAECVGPASSTLQSLLRKGILPRNDTAPVEDSESLVNDLWSKEDDRPRLSYSGLVSATTALRRLMRYMFTLANEGHGEWYKPLEQLFSEHSGGHTFSSMQYVVCLSHMMCGPCADAWLCC